jgi:spore coat protein U domain-containing protein, fimbrial subunit CupE1/2/3/6
MTTARSLLIAMLAVAPLIGPQPKAGEDQFPRGLMSAAPRIPTFCNIETRPINFGTYDTLAPVAVDAVGLIIYICGGEGGGGGGVDRGGGPPDGGGRGPRTGTRASVGIKIEMAEGYSSSFRVRNLAGREGGENIEYNIFLDATHTTVWGTGESFTGAYYDSNPPANTPVSVPAFGRIFAVQQGQGLSAGQYIDNVPVRILF